MCFNRNPSAHQPSIIKFTEEEKFPDKEEFAAMTALLLCALVGTTDSVTKSILSFRKAFFVNSPGSAITAPLFTASSTIKFTIVGSRDSEIQQHLLQYKSEVTQRRQQDHCQQSPI